MTKTIGFIFLQIANNYRIRLEKKMNEIGLHYGQISILGLLWTMDGQSQIELSNTLGLSQPTINKMVKSLAQSDFILCNKCENDGRIMRVNLTQKGRDVELFVKQEVDILQNEYFSILTETERLIFKQICDKLSENFISKNGSEPKVMLFEK